MPNIAPILDDQLNPAQARILKRAGRISSQNGVALYLVGGTVRDAMLGHRAIDLDLSVVSDDPAFASVLADGLDGEVVASSHFGTSKLKIGDIVIDLAMARKETYAYPGALPSVSPASIDEDLARRDFSINAMAVSLSPDTWGDLLDPFDGQGDLQRRLIRVLHPGSFVDDATRILRAVRYAGRLGFQLEPDTAQLIRQDMSYLDTIKGDRVRHEIERISNEERVESIFKLAQDIGALRAIHPALNLQDSALTGLRELNAEGTSNSDLLFLALLTYAASTSDRPALIRRLNMDSRWARVVRDTGSVKDSYDMLDSPNLKRSQLHELLNPFDASAIRGCALSANEPVVARHLDLFLSELRYVTPFLSGDDLIAMGAPEGPTIGTLLKAIMSGRLDGLIATEEDEKNFVNRNL